MAAASLKRVISITAIGVVLLAIGCALPAITELILRLEVNKILPLQNGSDVYNSWIDPRHDASQHLQFWVFDVVNAYEVVNEGAKPSLVQRGPFTYFQLSLKTDVNFSNTADDTISYRQQGTYFFDRSMSAESEDFLVTTLNFPPYVVEYMFRNQPNTEKLLDFIIRLVENEHLFVQLSVRELLWGYEDKFLKDLLYVLQIPDVARVVKAFNISIPPLDSHFGYYYNKNGSNNGQFKIFQGHLDMSKFLTVDTWNDKRTLNYWRANECNLINGTDGSEFPPFLDRSSTLYFFSTDLCRSLSMVYHDDVMVQGIKTYEFRPPTDIFSYQSGSGADNVCYCSDDKSCPLDGVLDMGLCANGAPLFVSQPHFLYGSNDYVTGVIGLQPMDSDHNLHSYIEPNTGVVLECMIRLQLNLKLTNITSIKEARNLPEMLMFPLIWFNATAIVSQTRLDDFKSQFVMFLNICNIMTYVLISTGALVLACLVMYTFRRYRSSAKSELGGRENTSPPPNETSPLLVNDGMHTCT